MIFFEIALIGMACIVLILMFVIWDTLRTGLHVPYDDQDTLHQDWIERRRRENQLH